MEKCDDSHTLDNCLDCFSFLETSEDRMWFVNKELRLVYGNKLFCDHYEQLCGQIIKPGDSVLSNSFPENYTKIWMEYFERAFSGESFHVDQLTRYNNQREDVEYYFYPVKNSNDVIAGVLVVAKKVTLQKETSDKLARSLTLFSKMESLLEFGTWEYSVDRDTIYLSSATQKYYYLEKPHLSFDNLLSFIDPKYHLLIKNTARKVIVTGTQSEVEFKYKRPYDNRYVDVQIIINYDSERKIAFGAVRDITARKKKEIELTRSENLFRSIWDNSKDGMRLTDSDGIIIKVNDTFCKMVEKNREDIEGKPLSVVYEPESGKRILNAYKKNINNTQRESNFENKYILWNNDVIWFSVTVSQLENLSSEILILSIFRNITERKKSEEILKQREAQIFSIFTAAPVGIGLTIGRTFVEVNDAFSTITGYDYFDVIGKKTSLLYLSEEDFESITRHMDENIPISGTSTIEVNWRRKDGKIIDVVLGCTPIDMSNWTKGITFTVMDISDRKKYETELLHKEKMLFAIAKATKELLTNRNKYEAIQHGLGLLGEAIDVDRVYFFEVDLKDGKSLNSFSQKLEWVSKGDIAEIDNPDLQLVPFDSCREFVDILLRGEIFSHIVRLLPDSRSKETFISQNIVSISIIPVFVKGQFYGFVGFDDCKDERIWSDSDFSLLGAFADSVAKSIERLLVEKELEDTLKILKETQRQALLQERLRSLGQMTSGICHDINNSLTPIMGYIEMLKEDTELIDKHEKAFNMILKSTEDIAHTIARLKEFYKLKLSSDELFFIDVKKLIHDTVELTKHRWKTMPSSTGSFIEISETYDNDLPKIKADESELREAITNLILNACDAMPNGGKLSLKAYASMDKFFIEINDTGVGMNEDTLSRCIDPFFTTKGDKGTGLGLSMVFGVVERHKGEIKIESAPGRGTKIKLILPLDREIKEEKYISQLTINIPSLNILYVEDDAIIADMVKIILEKRKHSVTLCNNGSSALDVFNEKIVTEEPFDLVITDLGMAQMDGITLSKHLKKIAPKIPVILFTGWGALINKDELTTIDRLMKKPIMKEELFKTIGSLFQ